MYIFGLYKYFFHNGEGFLDFKRRLHLDKMVILRTVHWKALWGIQNILRKPPFGTFNFNVDYIGQILFKIIQPFNKLLLKNKYIINETCL